MTIYKIFPNLFKLKNIKISNQVIIFDKWNESLFVKIYKYPHSSDNNSDVETKIKRSRWSARTVML